MREARSGHIGTTDDVARVAASPASPDSAFANGAVYGWTVGVTPGRVEAQQPGASRDLPEGATSST